MIELSNITQSIPQETVAVQVLLSYTGTGTGNRREVPQNHGDPIDVGRVDDRRATQPLRDAFIRHALAKRSTSVSTLPR